MIFFRGLTLITCKTEITEIFTFSEVLVLWKSNRLFDKDVIDFNFLSFDNGESIFEWFPFINDGNVLIKC